MKDKPIPPPNSKPPIPVDPVDDVLGGGGVRREVLGCPTGLADLLPKNPKAEEDADDQDESEKPRPRDEQIP